MERVDEKEKRGERGRKRRQREWRGRGGCRKRQKEKPLHPSVSTSRPPSVAGLSLFPLSAFLFSLFPFCLPFSAWWWSTDFTFSRRKRHTSVCVCASLSAKWTFDAIEALRGRKATFLATLAEATAQVLQGVASLMAARCRLQQRQFTKLDTCFL